MPGMPLKAQRVAAKMRHITRSEHEGVLDTMQKRLDQALDSMQVRRQTAAYPFGTIKAWMEATHVLTRMLRWVSTKMSLHVAYHMKRLVAIRRVEPLIRAIRT